MLYQCNAFQLCLLLCVLSFVLCRCKQNYWSIKIVNAPSEGCGASLSPCWSHGSPGSCTLISTLQLLLVLWPSSNTYLISPDSQPSKLEVHHGLWLTSPGTLWSQSKPQPTDPCISRSLRSYANDVCHICPSDQYHKFS